MEDLLDLYKEAYNHNYPVVCFDEKSYQLTDYVTEPIPATLNHLKLEDYEYIRKGTSNLFIFVEPKGGSRHIEVTNRRTKEDFANAMKLLTEELYPKAKKIRLVLDNLNTHKLSTLYEFFEADIARNIVKKIELHYTPVHASWLNMAEIEISIVARQCLNKRIAAIDKLKQEISIWQNDRNYKKVKIRWGFTTKKARKKLTSFYSKLT